MKINYTNHIQGILDGPAVRKNQLTKLEER